MIYIKNVYCFEQNEVFIFRMFVFYFVCMYKCLEIVCLLLEYGVDLFYCDDCDYRMVVWVLFMYWMVLDLLINCLLIDDEEVDEV